MWGDFCGLLWFPAEIDLHGVQFLHLFQEYMSYHDDQVFIIKYIILDNEAVK